MDVLHTNDGFTLLLCDREQRKVPDSLMPYLERKCNGNWEEIKRVLSVRSFMEAFRGVDPECPWCHEILSPNGGTQCPFCLNEYQLVTTQKVKAVKCTSTSDQDTEKPLLHSESSTASSPGQSRVTLDH